MADAPKVLDQVSKPYRIALGALLVLAVAWFAVLKPGGEEAPVAAAAATTAQPAAATPARTTTTKAKPARRMSSTPARAGRTTDEVAPVLAALRRGDVAVLAFLQPGGADDARVRTAVRGLTGPVRTFTADIADVGDYAAITRGVPVAQAPATLVIGDDRSARLIYGLTTRGELQQLVDDQAER